VTIVPPEINVPQPGVAPLIVGRDPGEHEVAQGRPFVGLAGQELDHALAEAGLSRDRVNITNLVNVRPPGNDFTKHDPAMIAQGTAELFALIRRLRPPIIVALGNEASYALIPGWPTSGNGIFGAKNIHERRGFCWTIPDGTVLATLHPAGVLRQPVPFRFLLRADMRKLRRLLAGKRLQPLPDAQPLTPDVADTLRRHTLLAWDIETQWGGKAISMMGFAGDDAVPYVACGQQAILRAALPLLRAGVEKVGHNGWHFDVPAVILHYGFSPVRYAHDTQLLWHALDPELAGGLETGSRLTRKGLAFLASLFLDTFWWKDYPDEHDEAALQQMVTLNARDVWATRILFDILATRAKEEKVWPQYQLICAASGLFLEPHLHGVPIDRDLLDQRVQALTERFEARAAQATEAALAYLQTLSRPLFGKRSRCPCCQGRGAHCWRCGGLPKRPERKADYAGLPGRTIAELRAALPECRECRGAGTKTVITFNPFSPQQLYRLLCQHLGAPTSRWQGKVKMDEDALRRIYRWSLR
jgi:uracil-DNA glycosylase family 4